MEVEVDDTLTKQTDAEFENEKFAKSLGGRPKKLFKNLTSTTAKHDRLRPILNNCLRYCEEEELPFDEFLGELGKYYYNSIGGDFKKAKLFGKIAEGSNPLEKHTMSVPRSLAFKDFAGLGQKPYDDVRKMLNPVLELGRFIIIIISLQSKLIPIKITFI